MPIVAAPLGLATEADGILIGRQRAWRLRSSSVMPVPRIAALGIPWSICHESNLRAFMRVSVIDKGLHTFIYMLIPFAGKRPFDKPAQFIIRIYSTLQRLLQRKQPNQPYQKRNRTQNVWGNFDNRCYGPTRRCYHQSSTCVRHSKINPCPDTRQNFQVGTETCGAIETNLPGPGQS